MLCQLPQNSVSYKFISTAPFTTTYSMWKQKVGGSWEIWSCEWLCVYRGGRSFPVTSVQELRWRLERAQRECSLLTMKKYVFCNPSLPPLFTLAYIDVIHVMKSPKATPPPSPVRHIYCKTGQYNGLGDKARIEACAHRSSNAKKHTKIDH